MRSVKKRETNLKKAALEKHGIILIEVPYAWTKSQKFVTDLLLKNGIDYRSFSCTTKILKNILNWHCSFACLLNQ